MIERDAQSACFKEAPGFPPLFCLQSLRSLLLIPGPSESARAAPTIFPFCLAKTVDFYEEETEKIFCIDRIVILESYSSVLVAVTSDISSFLARGLMVPLLPQVLLVLPIISHSTGLAVWSLAFMAV